MVRRKYRFPITSRIVLLALHDIMVKAAENKADSGGVILRIRRSIVIESAAVIEKIIQWALERKMKSEGGGKGGKGGKGGERDTVRIEDMGVDADVPRSRLDAAMRGGLSAAAVRSAAATCELPALARLMDRGGAQRVDAMMNQRHGYVHWLSHEEPDDIGACDTAENVVRAVLDGSPLYRAAVKLAEGSCMRTAGREGDACAAYEVALEDCRACGGSGPDAAQALVCAGLALARLGRTGEAEATLRDAAEADSRSPLAHLELGHLALLDGHPVDADRSYATAARIDPSYAPARVFRGHAQLMRKEPGGRLAVVQYDGGLALDPNDVSAHVGLGLAMAEQGRHAEAVAHFERGIRIDPEDAAPRVALGHTLVALGRDPEAAAAYEGAIEMAARFGPRDSAADSGVDKTVRLRYRLGGASAHIGLAGAMARMGRPERALVHYREAVGIGGSSSSSTAVAHAGAARMLATLGRWEEAVTEYRRAAEIDPPGAEARLGLADALSKAGRHEEAVPEYRRAAEIDPASARARLGLAESLSETGRPWEAVPEHYAAIGLDPGSARAYIGLANALSKAGRHEEAVPEYHAAIGLDPGSARAYIGLADALSALGMTAEAQRAYDRAVDLDPSIDRGRYSTFGR